MEGVLWSLHRAVEIWRPTPWDLPFERVGHALPGIAACGTHDIKDELIRSFVRRDCRVTCAIVARWGTRNYAGIPRDTNLHGNA